MGETEHQQKARLNYEVQVYREQLRLIERELERINLTTIDLSNALRTVENMKNDEVMIPVGGGTFIKADISTTKVLVPVGAGYILEMEKHTAGAEIKKRIEATKRALDKLSEQFNLTSSKMQEIGGKLRGIASAVEKENQMEAYV